MFDLLFTIWVFLATLLEDRALVAAYGEAYRSYQRKVPMLIPWRIRPG
jgi:protein-S-isoprenylcysteine O-methyltransferase Ste14